MASVCYSYLVMNLLRMAVKETVRALGLNFPTALVVVFSIGFSIIIVPVVPTPETASVPGFVLWLYRATAYLIAILVVFLLFLVWNTARVAHRDLSVSAHLRMVTEIDASADDRMKSFLRNALSDPCYGVAKCYAFGSVVGQYPTRDVDIVIQFDSSEQGQVRTYRDRLRSVESRFQEFHGLVLHVQTFLSTEDEALDIFLDYAGLHERLI